MKFYTIFDIETKKYWSVIDDMNSTEKWGDGFMFWDNEEEARECLKYHQDEYSDYYSCHVVEFELGIENCSCLCHVKYCSKCIKKHE